MNKFRATRGVISTFFIIGGKMFAGHFRSLSGHVVTFLGGAVGGGGQVGIKTVKYVT